jgi:hypothetical protein
MFIDGTMIKIKGDLVLAARSPCSIMANYFQTEAEFDEALP